MDFLLASLASPRTSSGSGTSRVVPWGAFIAIRVSFYQQPTIKNQQHLVENRKIKVTGLREQHLCRLPAESSSGYFLK